MRPSQPRVCLETPSTDHSTKRTVNISKRIKAHTAGRVIKVRYRLSNKFNDNDESGGDKLKRGDGRDRQDQDRNRKSEEDCDNEKYLFH